MDALTTDFWKVLLWSFWIFIWVGAIFVWVRCIFDMFGDRTLSGGAKAGWAILMILLPWLGAVIYLIARGRSMADRQMDALAEQQAMQEKYIQQVVGTPSPAEQIAKAKALLDSGAITQTEFDALKGRALA